ncbi:hypothetical protein L7F22_037669 [Adiantum nelumboides]|nr:hypothetical protein [Adiantum nelumboides]
MELQQVKDGFEAKQGFPNCCGAIDVTHINMDLPPGEVLAHWFDRDHNYSMTLQAVVDSDMRFLDIMCGMPGVCNDIRILQNSSLYMKAKSNAILNDPPLIRGGHRVREYFVGNEGYLDLPWRVMPDMNKQMQLFNYKLSSTRIVVERAFGHLKQMWGYLHKRINQLDVALLPKIIATCCNFHNSWPQFGVSYDCNEPEGYLDEPATRPIEAALSCGDNTRDFLFQYMQAGHMD